MGIGPLGNKGGPGTQPSTCQDRAQRLLQPLELAAHGQLQQLEAGEDERDLPGGSQLGREQQDSSHPPLISLLRWAQRQQRPNTDFQSNVCTWLLLY